MRGVGPGENIENGPIRGILAQNRSCWLHSSTVKESYSTTYEHSRNFSRGLIEDVGAFVRFQLTLLVTDSSAGQHASSALRLDMPSSVGVRTL